MKHVGVFLRATLPCSVRNKTKLMFGKGGGGKWEKGGIMGLCVQLCVSVCTKIFFSSIWVIDKSM